MLEQDAPLTLEQGENLYQPKAAEALLNLLNEIKDKVCFIDIDYIIDVNNKTPFVKQVLERGNLRHNTRAEGEGIIAPVYYTHFVGMDRPEFRSKMVLAKEENKFLRDVNHYWSEVKENEIEDHLRKFLFYEDPKVGLNHVYVGIGVLKGVWKEKMSIGDSSYVYSHPLQFGSNFEGCVWLISSAPEGRTYLKEVVGTCASWSNLEKEDREQCPTLEIINSFPLKNLKDCKKKWECRK